MREHSVHNFATTDSNLVAAVAVGKLVGWDFVGVCEKRARSVQRIVHELRCELETNRNHEKGCVVNRVVTFLWERRRFGDGGVGGGRDCRGGDECHHLGDTNCASDGGAGVDCLL